MCTLCWQKPSKVIGTSPTGRWKLLVSLCHLSTKADISPRSLVSNEHAIKELNLVATTNTSISTVDLPNFWTFLPWDDNFNLGRSEKKLNNFNNNNKYLLITMRAFALRLHWERVDHCLVELARATPWPLGGSGVVVDVGGGRVRAVADVNGEETH